MMTSLMNGPKKYDRPERKSPPQMRLHSFSFTHLPVLVMIISVPTSLNCDHSSEFSRSALMLGSFCPAGEPAAEEDGSIPIRGTGAGVAKGIPGIPVRKRKDVSASSLCRS